MCLRLACLLLLALAGLARADSAAPIDIARDVRFDQNLGAQVSPDLPFISDAGAPVHLGDYFHHRPLLLVLDYYRCPNLCGIVLHSLVASLKNLTFNAGDRYDVVVVSIDPRDTPQTSALKKEGYLDSYERPQTANGWHFLTGSPESIQTLANTVGFHFVYDPRSNQYAHPSGMIVLTSQGKTSRYFFGVEFPPAQIRDALAVAAASRINSPVYDFLLLCCSYNPLQGKYGVLIFNLMRGAGVLTVLVLAGYIVRALRQEAAQNVPTGEPTRMSFPLLPYEDSNYAENVDAIFMSLLVLCSLMTLAVFVVIGYFSVKYRRGSKADRGHRLAERTEIGIEFTWIILPLILFIGLFIWAGNVYYEMFSPPSNGLAVYVIGKQWMWKIEHATGQREINQLHVPVDRNIILTMTSQDVIHDFDIPAFRIKHDVLPGRYNRMWFKATHIGTYHLFCGQYCGDFHSEMIGEVIVMTAADYAAWLQHEGPETSEALASEGSRYYHALGCSGCHEGSQVVHAPSLAGLYDEPVPLQTGQVVKADDDYLRDSILQPGKDICAGYQNIMPSYQGTLSEEQVIALIAYIKSQRSVNVSGDSP